MLMLVGGNQVLRPETFEVSGVTVGTANRYSSHCEKDGPREERTPCQGRDRKGLF